MRAEDIALRLAKLRLEKGVTARKMSLLLGQNENYISAIERRKYLPSMQGLLDICNYLGITMKDFFDKDIKNPSKINEIIKDLKKLDKSQLEAVSSIVKEMNKK